jgi:DUF1680 family protein
VKINGQSLEAVADSGSYLAIRRVWQDGDTVSIRLPMELRQEVLLGDDSVSAVLYGPLVLATNLGPGPVDGPNKIIHGRSTAPDNIPSPDPLPKSNAAPGVKPDQWVETESKSELRFKAVTEGSKHEIMPMYQIRDQRYSVYWQSNKPKDKS